MLATTRECPSCALTVDRKEEICPYCQYEFPDQKSYVPYVVGLFIILMLGWFFGC